MFQISGVRFQLRHPVCKALTVVMAALYWASVGAAYLAAESAHGTLGYAAVPFLLLSAPWSGLLYGLVSLIPNHDVAHVTLSVSCLLLSGINAFILYLLADRVLSRFSDRLLG